MKQHAMQHASQLTGRDAILEPNCVKDAHKELQIAILMLSAMLHVVFQELFAIILKESAIHAILFKTQSANKHKELVMLIVPKLTMTIQFAILKQDNAKNAPKIRLHQVASQMMLVTKLAHQNLQLNICMNAIGLQVNQHATKLKMVPKHFNNATPIAELIPMVNVMKLKRNASDANKEKIQIACILWISARL